MSAIKLQYIQETSSFDPLKSEEDEFNQHGHIVASQEYGETPSQSQTQQQQDSRERSRQKRSCIGSSVTSKALTTPHETFLYLIVLIWLVILSSVSLSPDLTHTQKEYVVGIFSNINLVSFFGAPLSSIATVLKSRNSGSIHRKTLLLNSLNATFWGIYGMAVHDPLIAIPNILGLLLGLVQAVLCIIFQSELAVVQTELSMQLNRNDGCIDSGDDNSERQKDA